MALPSLHKPAGVANSTSRRCTAPPSLHWAGRVNSTSSRCTAHPSLRWLGRVNSTSGRYMYPPFIRLPAGLLKTRGRSPQLSLHTPTPQKIAITWSLDKTMDKGCCEKRMDKGLIKESIKGCIVKGVWMFVRPESDLQLAFRRRKSNSGPKC